MVELGQVLAYAFVVFVGAIAPGADFAIVSRYAALYGRRAGLAAAAGIAGGLGVNATAALLGMAAVLLASPTLYAVIKLAGAAYLIYLGASALWSLRPQRDGGEGAESSPVSVEGEPSKPGQGAGTSVVTSSERATALRAFRQALLTNLLNPKPIIFLVTLMPQFLPLDPTTLSRVILGLVTVLAAFLWFALVALVFSAFARFFARPTVSRIIVLITGVMLVSIGVAFVATSISDVF